MNASDIMTAHDLWVCADDANVRQVAEMMAEHNVGAIPILDKEGRLEGIITDRDICCRLVGQGNSYDTHICEIMSGDVKTVHADTDLEEVESIMRQCKIRRLPVVDDDNKLQGFISISDLARHCHGVQEEHDLMATIETICAP